MSNLLTVEDAVKVCMSFLYETTYFDDMPKEEEESFKEHVANEFEQKCWIGRQYDDAVKELSDLTFDINPAEIASQIESDNLREWCKTIQVAMRMAMVRLPLK